MSKNKPVVAIVPPVEVLDAPTPPAAQLGGSNGGPTIEERIKEWGRMAKAVQDDFHPLAIDVLIRVMDTRNATIALQLQNAMPKILRKREFAAWLAQVSPIRLYEEDKDSNFTKCELRDEKDKFYRPFDIEKAKESPFFDKKEEVKALDPAKMSLAKTLMTPINTLVKTILGEGDKKLADGTSLEEAQGRLKEYKQAYNRLAHMKSVPPMSGNEGERVNKALAVKAAA